MNAMRMKNMFKGASELTNEATLPEADAMRFVRLDKPGGFVGLDATRRSAERRDRPWQCAYLEVDVGDADCLGGKAILAGGERTGAVSSGAGRAWPHPLRSATSGRSMRRPAPIWR